MIDLVENLPQHKTSNCIFLNQGNLNFDKMKNEVKLNSNGIVTADLDNDGDLDIVYNSIDHGVLVKKNNTNPKEYLKVKLIGSRQNTSAVGARLSLQSEKGKQYLDPYQVRGFMSSLPYEYIFKAKVGNELTIQWPDGTESVTTVQKISETLVVDYSKVKRKKTAKKKKPKAKFKEKMVLKNKHVENKYNDFDFEPLLNHQYSKVGPCIAVGDLNKDNLQDIFIGNSKGAVPSIYFQNSYGGFQNQPIDILKEFGDYEDTDATIFDFNNDGYNDLYIVSGGNEYEEGHQLYQDRLLLNNNQKFENASHLLPKTGACGKTVVPLDYNQDGFMDLFIASNVKTFNVPIYLLKVIC